MHLPLEITDNIILFYKHNIKKDLYNLCSPWLKTIMDTPLISCSEYNLQMKVICDYQNFSCNDIQTLFGICMYRKDLTLANFVLKRRKHVLAVNNFDWKFIFNYALGISIKYGFDFGVKWCFSNGKRYDSFKNKSCYISVLMMFKGTEVMVWLNRNKLASNDVIYECVHWAYFHENYDIINWVSMRYPRIMEQYGFINEE